MNIRTGYLRKVYEPNEFSKAFEKAVKSIRAFKKVRSFDAIAFTGTSGAAFAYPLSLRLKIPLICIRKRPSDSHYADKFEGSLDAKRYIIVDDFIASGNTVNRIKRAVNEKLPKASLVGIYLYENKADIKSFNRVKIIQ